MIKGAVFDLDGTILDSMHVWDDLADKYLLSIGITPPKGLNEIFAKMTTLQSAYWLKENLNIDKDVNEIIDGYNVLLHRFYRKEVGIKKEFIECYEYMKKNNIPMIIATSSGIESVKASLKRHGLEDEFEYILTCNELDTDKTKPFIYIKAAELLNSDPKDIWVFEDSYFCVKTAKEAGFHVCAVYDESNKKYEAETISLADNYFKINENKE